MCSHILSENYILINAYTSKHIKLNIMLQLVNNCTTTTTTTSTTASTTTNTKEYYTSKVILIFK
jgi:hypothetical protein